MPNPPNTGSPTLTNDGADDNERIHEILEELRNHDDASDPVKLLLRAYDATKNHARNLKTLLKCTDSTLHSAAEFLGGTPTDPTGNPRYKSRESLCDWVIMAIEGLLPQYCLACKSTYTLERGIKPKFRCASCGGGSHDCSGVTSQTPTTTPGFVWICTGCLGKFNLETFLGADEEEAPPLSGASHRKFSFPTNVDVAETQNHQKEEKIGVCKFYLQRRCRHGRDGTKLVNGKACRKSHPQLCKKFCNYGTMMRVGCQATDCNYFHPPLYRNSELRNECLKENCKKHHLKDTRRKRPTNNPNDRTRSRSKNPEIRASNPESTRRQDRAEERSPESEFNPAFLDVLMDRLKDSIAELVASELQRHQAPPVPTYTAPPSQLPPGMGYTISPHPQGIIRTF